MAPKLKEKHITLPPFSAMRVSLVAQVLSHSIAAGITTLVALKYLSPAANDTAQFVEHFDSLFNVFNSRTVKTSKKLASAFSETSCHSKFLTESLEFLNKI